MKSTLLDQEAAKAAAKRIFQKVNFSGGPLQSYEISSLLTDTYDYLKIPFKATSRDIKTYSQVLDTDRDGKVTLTDLETLAIQYLCGFGVLTNQPFDSIAKKQKLEVSTNSYQTSNANAQLQTNYIETPMQSKTPVNQQKQVRSNSQYSQQIKQYISMTKAIFQRNADQHFTITSDRVPKLLAQTYEALGRKGFTSNEQDIRGWMQLCDGNGDGHVEYEQYEYFILRSLQRSGRQIYK